MSRSTISTFKLFELFPDEPSARKYLEGRLWPNGVTCPECQSKDRITVRKDGYYRCNACKLDFAGIHLMGIDGHITPAKSVIGSYCL